MSDTIPRPNPVDRSNRWTPATLICLVWLVVIASAIAKLRQADGIVAACLGFGAAAITFVVVARADRARRREMIRDATDLVRSVRDRRRTGAALPIAPDLARLAAELAELQRAARHRALMRRASDPPPSVNVAEPRTPLSGTSLTRSGLFDAPTLDEMGHFDPNMSGDYSTIDMVNRLDPNGFRWIESSPAEQDFLGWTLTELRQKSFMDVVHPDDRRRVQETLGQALVRGEALGLVVRIRTAQGKTRAIEVNVGARYGTNQKISHLRCHLTDVTEKVRAERALRLRTLELTQVNAQLRRINRELEELKDRYTDLYENAPAMYFSLDMEGNVIECNQTMLSTLGKGREEVIGHSYQRLLPEPLWEDFRADFATIVGRGDIEKETYWIKSKGEMIAVRAYGTLVPNPKGSSTQARFVAQDVTAKRHLEAELQEKNRRLARANDELSRKNQELDEFVYVVSHDLQEPLRTLIAFSDFLLNDYGDRLEADGQEYVRYLVDASRRMRAMIHGMLNLSRAGKVIGEFVAVDLNDLVAVVRTDLRELIRSKDADVRVAGPLPTIWGDRDRIGQLLANLIANGLKYNQSRNPLVEIGVIESHGRSPANGDRESNTGDEATIYVRDNGIGIDPQFHGTIFQLFRRLHTREQYEGTGAGLAICNKIVQAHGGRIWVESALGEGATFFVRLTGRNAPLALMAPAPVDPISVSLPAYPTKQVPQDEHGAS